MSLRREHPFATQWNHNTHYFPMIADRIPVSADRLLDVGCGVGTFCHFVQSDRRLVVGADLDPSVLPPATDRATYVATSADDLPFGDGTFAAVTMTMVLHHVHSGRALAEATRVLAAGGVLIILGFGRYGGWRDAPYEVRDVVINRIVSRRMQAWDPPTAKADPPDTWAESRAMVRDALPGCAYRRLPMWRYLVEWHKPPAVATLGGGAPYRHNNTGCASPGA